MADSQIARVKSCKQCGSDYQWVRGQMADRRGTCSAECRRARDAARQARWQDANKKSKQPKPCGHCDEPTTRRRYCSTRCSLRARDRRLGIQSWAERYPVTRLVERSCAVCGASFERRQRVGDAALCCSRECGFTLIRWRGEQSRAFQQAKAEFFRWAAIASGKLRTRCSLCPSPLKDGQRLYCKPCAKEHWRLRSLEYYRASRGDVTCADCDTPIANDGSYQRRCEPCREAARQRNKEAARTSPSYLRSKRAAKARRRALERGAKAERFDPLEILARDGWRCHICGVSTPKRLRGTYEDRAPELDHIVPLALGGEHTRINTACACRKCNGAKGAEPLGQLRLVA